MTTDRETGTEQTPAGPMGTEWLDAVYALIGPTPSKDFTAAEFTLLAEMHGVSAQEAARRLVGGDECTEQS